MGTGTRINQTEIEQNGSENEGRITKKLSEIGG